MGYYALRVRVRVSDHELYRSFRSRKASGSADGWPAEGRAAGPEAAARVLQEGLGVDSDGSAAQAAGQGGTVTDSEAEQRLAGSRLCGPERVCGCCDSE